MALMIGVGPVAKPWSKARNETMLSMHDPLRNLCASGEKKGTDQSHPGTQDFTERIKPNDPSAAGNDLGLELKVTLGPFRREKVVRVVLDDEQFVFVREPEDVEFAFGAGTGACRVRSRGNGAVFGASKKVKVSVRACERGIPRKQQTH